MRNWLADGEQVLIRCRPHARILVWPVVVGLLVIMGAGAALARLQPVQYASWAADVPLLREPAIVLLVTLVLFIEILYPVRRALQWAGTRYILTSRRFVLRRGTLGRRSHECLLTQVHSIEMRQKLRQRPVGSGELDVHLQNGTRHTFHEVPCVDEFHAEVQTAWSQALRASFQQAPGPGYYAGQVGLGANDDDGHLNGKELRKLGRDQ